MTPGPLPTWNRWLALAGVVFTLAYAAAIVVAVFMPSYAPWGLSHLSGQGPVTAIAALVIVSMASMWVARTSRRETARAAIRHERSARLAVAVIVAALLVVLRTRTHLLGDGYLQISDVDRLLSDRLWTGSYEPLWLLLIGWIHAATAWLGAGPELPFTIYSVTCGVLYVDLSWRLARDQCGAGHRALVLGSLLSSSVVALFHGYAEVYAGVHAAALLWIYLGTRPTVTPRRVCGLGVLAGSLVLLHVSLLTLWPSLIVLALAATRRSGPTIRWATAAGSLALAVAVALAGGGLLGVTWLQWSPEIRHGHLLPLCGELEQHQLYHLLSRPHADDLANLALLLLPATLILLPVALPGIRRQAGESMFLPTVVVGTMLFTLLVNPEIGFFRDWDLLALPAVPLTVLVLQGVLHLEHRPRWAPAWFTIVIGLAAVNTASWIACGASQSRTEARYVNLMETASLSRPARTYGWESLGTYQRIDRNDLAAAADSYARAVAADPHNPRLHDLAGVVATRQGDHATAIRYLRRAVSLTDARNTTYLHNLAAALSAGGDHDGAVAVFRRALLVAPQTADRYRTLGLALLNARRFDAAADTLAIAVTMAPDDSLAARALAVAQQERLH